jgi:hypothetical protein
MKPKLTIDDYGYEEWKLPNGKFHREDGPAYEDSDGNKSWWINGNLHNKDGPAVECSNGSKHWYLNGISYTEQEYKKKMRSRKLKLLL